MQRSKFDKNKMKMSITYTESSLNISVMSSYGDFKDRCTGNFQKLELEDILEVIDIKYRIYESSNILCLLIASYGNADKENSPSRPSNHLQFPSSCFLGT